MQPLDPRWRTAPPPAGERLPILVNVPAADAQLGRQTESPQIRAALQLISEFDHSPMAGMAELQTHQCRRAGNSPGHHQPGGADHFFAESLRRAIAPLAAHLRSIPEMGPGHHLAGPVHCQQSAGVLGGAQRRAAAAAAPARPNHHEPKKNMFDSSSIIVGLEIGTSKICAVVGEINAASTLNIIGVGQARSRGVRKGEIADAAAGRGRRAQRHRRSRADGQCRNSQRLSGRHRQPRSRLQQSWRSSRCFGRPRNHRGRRAGRDQERQGHQSSGRQQRRPRHPPAFSGGRPDTAF